VGGVAHARSRGVAVCAIESSGWATRSASTSIVCGIDRERILSTFCCEGRLKPGLVGEEGGGLVEEVRPVDNGTFGDQATVKA
jgi:hypothetical protein